MTSDLRKGVAVVAAVLAHSILLLRWPAPSLQLSQARERLAVRLIQPSRIPPQAARQPPGAAREVARARIPLDARPRSASAGQRHEPAGESKEIQEDRPAGTGDSSRSSSPGPLPLDLSVRPVPRRGSSSEAMIDPRSNTPRPTPADRMAQLLGSDDRRYEEIRPDGSVRIRQGASCFDARLTRATELDAFNSAIHSAPRTISPCN